RGTRPDLISRGQAAEPRGVARPALFLLLVSVDGLALRPRTVQAGPRRRRSAGPDQARVLVLSGIEKAGDRLAARNPPRAPRPRTADRADRPGEAPLGPGAGPLLRPGVPPPPPRRPAPLRRGSRRLTRTARPLRWPANSCRPIVARANCVQCSRRAAPPPPPP